ncbi:hypothetical protein, partial [Vibrio parahaemolyticus]
LFGDKTLSLTTVFVFSSRLSAMNLFCLFKQQITQNRTGNTQTNNLGVYKVFKALYYSRQQRRDG